MFAARISLWFGTVMSEWTSLHSDFSMQKNQSYAPSFLLFRKRSHSRRLFGCKRPHNAFGLLSTFCECAVKCTYGAWNIRFADVKRQISFHRERSSLFHNLRQQIISHWAKAKYFTIKSWMCVINKMIFASIMNVRVANHRGVCAVGTLAKRW